MTDNYLGAKHFLQAKTAASLGLKCIAPLGLSQVENQLMLMPTSNVVGSLNPVLKRTAR
jgi:hypothetical protein